MPIMKVVQKNVDKLQAPSGTGKQVAYWDGGHKDALKGFGVLVSGVSSKKAYVVQAGVKGLTRRITVGRCELISYEKAREKAKKELAKLTLGVDPKAGQGAPTLAEALEQYLDARKKNLSKNTIQSYSNLVNKHLSGWLKKPLNTITVDMVQERHRKLGESEAAGEATANGAMRALRLLWNFVLEKQSTLGPHPVRLKKMWHEVKPRKRLVKNEQLPAFFRAVCSLPNPVHRDYLLMLLFTGMRRRECAALRWDHIDFTAKTMHIPEENTKSGEKLDLPLSDFLFDLLVVRRAPGNSGGWVFPSNSKSGHIEEPKFALDQVEEATGINVSPHDLRRTFITAAERCPISGMVRMALVNHASGKSVHGDYVQLEVEDLREPAQMVADRLKQLCEIEAVAGNVQRLR